MKRIGILLFIFYLFIQQPVAARNPEIYFSIIFRKQITVIGQDTQIYGLYHGEKDAQTWQHLGSKNLSIFGVAVDTASAGQNIYLACSNGILRSRDHGDSWKIVTDWTMTELTKVYIQPGNKNVLFTTSSFGLWKSTDQGETWQKITRGLKPTSQTFCTCLAFLPSNPRTVFLATADGVMKSDDGGDNWQPCGVAGREVHQIVIAPYDEKIMAAATDDAGVYISKDGGRTWRQSAMGMRGRTIYTVAFAPQQKGVLYCGGYLCGINKTTDFGEKWQPLDNEIADRSIRNLAVYPGDEQWLFAGLLNYGLWRSGDGGKNFSCVGECDGRVYTLAIF